MNLIGLPVALVKEYIVLNLLGYYDVLVNQRRQGQRESAFHTSLHFRCLANWNVLILRDNRNKGTFSGASQAHDENVDFSRP